jgi:NADPH-dependent ferric siderophore reductase
MSGLTQYAPCESSELERRTREPVLASDESGYPAINNEEAK